MLFRSENIRFPIHLVNNALQGKIDGTGTTIFRFLINSTVGVFGLFDVAKHLGMPRRNADFGQTLGIWGVPSGPYLVWPILGSSSIRDSAGMAVDSYLNITGLLVDWPWLAGQRVLETVNDRALLLDDIDRAREASFDFYVAVRAAYEAHEPGADLDALQTEIEHLDAWNWEQRVATTLDRLHLDGSRLMGELSGGMKKRVALAQALVAEIGRAHV